MSCGCSAAFLNNATIRPTKFIPHSNNTDELIEEMNKIYDKEVKELKEKNQKLEIELTNAINYAQYLKNIIRELESKHN